MNNAAIGANAVVKDLQAAGGKARAFAMDVTDGHPKKAAQAIVRLTQEQKPPSRLFLGERDGNGLGLNKVVVTRYRMHLEARGLAPGTVNFDSPLFVGWHMKLVTRSFVGSHQMPSFMDR